MRKTGRADHSAPDSPAAPVPANAALMLYAGPATASPTVTMDPSATPEAEVAAGSVAESETAQVAEYPAGSTGAGTAAAGSAVASNAVEPPADQPETDHTADLLFQPETQARFRTVYTVLSVLIRPLRRASPQLLRLARVVRVPWLLIPLALGAVLFTLRFPFGRLVPGLFSSRRKALSTLTFAGLMGGAILFSLPRADSGRKVSTEQSELQSLPSIAGEEIVITHDHETEIPAAGANQFATPLLIAPPGRQRVPSLSNTMPPPPQIVPGAWDTREVPATVQTVQVTLQQSQPASEPTDPQRVVWLTGTIEPESQFAAGHSPTGPRLR